MQLKRTIIKRGLVAILLILIILVLLVCIVSYQLVTNKCLWWHCVPDRDFNIYELEIPEWLYPEGADYSPLVNTRDFPSIEEAIGGASWDGGNAGYSLRRFATITQAHQRFLNQYRVDLIPRNPLEEHDNIYHEIYDYQSSVADEFWIGCGYFVEFQIKCSYLARFEEYFIHFSAYMSENYMTQKDFIEIIVYIDAMMDEKLMSK
jgi:hypothetical protein